MTELSLGEHGLRVATLSAFADLVSKELKAARKDAEAAFQVAYTDNGIRSLTFSLPDGEYLGDVTIKRPGNATKLDDAALLKWVEENTPTEVEEHLDDSALTDQELIEWAREHRDDLLRKRVRQAWLTEKVKQAETNGGCVINETTGESTKVAEVTPRKSTGAFALSADSRGERAARIIAALRAGELAEVVGVPVVLAIPAGGEGA